VICPDVTARLARRVEIESLVPNRRTRVCPHAPAIGIEHGDMADPAVIVAHLAFRPNHPIRLAAVRAVPAAVSARRAVTSILRRSGRSWMRGSRNVTSGEREGGAQARIAVDQGLRHSVRWWRTSRAA
jgi:hypothetical protein